MGAGRVLFCTVSFAGLGVSLSCEVFSMLSILISILVMCLIFGLIWWIFSLTPLPAPFAQVARVVIAVIFVVWLLYLLVPYTGFGHPLLVR